jgi:hypothetical protein
MVTEPGHGVLRTGTGEQGSRAGTGVAGSAVGEQGPGPWAQGLAQGPPHGEARGLGTGLEAFRYKEFAGKIWH